MNREQWKEFFKTGNGKPHCAGRVLSKAEVTSIFKDPNGTITSITYQDDLGNVAEFFSDNHIFGYPELGPDFISSTMLTRQPCVPRPGCEDGNINSLDKYHAVFKVELSIWSEDELIDFLATRFKVDDEIPKLKAWPRKGE